MALLLVASLVMALATAALYGRIGVLMLGRDVRGAGRRAIVMFATWWFALGVVALLQASRLGLLGLGVDSLPLHSTAAILGIMATILALWALQYYLVYLYTGREDVFHILTVCYAMLFAYVVYVFFWMDAQSVAFRHLGAELVFANDVGPHRVPLLLGFLGPATVSAALYGSLFFRLREGVQRYRVLLVSSAFLLWFGGFPLVGTLAGLNEMPWWPVVGRALGLLVPLLIMLAYRPPPPWLLARLERRALPAP